MWQVSDSPHLNGFFQQELTKAKRELSQFIQTDVIPLESKALKSSFAKKERQDLQLWNVDGIH
jgi:hypothetical protein